MRTLHLLLAVAALAGIPARSQTDTPISRCSESPLPPCSSQMEEVSASCPPQVVIGEEIPCKISGTTCGSVDSVNRYGSAPDSSTCTADAAGVTYPGEDVVYQVQLDGNRRVGFNLDVENSGGDLVLILAGRCGADDSGDNQNINNSCIINSPDFEGAGVGPEVIPATNLLAGREYFLYVDSYYAAGESGSCGEYCLTVTGQPDFPELELRLASDGPAEVVVGSEPQELSHELTIRNPSAMAASGLRVEVETTLPPGVGIRGFDPGPHSFDEGSGIWSVAALGPAESATLRIAYTIGTSVVDEAEIRSTARLEAVDQSYFGDPTTSVTTRVRRPVKLTLTVSGPNRVVAGIRRGNGISRGNLIYELEVHNDSDHAASQVVVMVDQVIPKVGVSRISVNRADFDESTGRWDVGGLSPRGWKTLQQRFTVRPFAAHGAVVRLTASATELAEPHDGTLPTDSQTTRIRRRVSLAIAQEAEPFDDVVAGSGEGEVNLTFTASVTNQGPSLVSELILSSILDDLPDDVTLENTVSDHGTFDGEIRTWTIPELPRDETASLTLAFTVGPAAPDGSEITHELAFERAIGGVTVETSGPLTVPVTAETDLSLDMLVDAENGNLIYTFGIGNAGPSSSTGAKICVDLSDGLEFVSSPAPCRTTAEGVDCEDVVPDVVCDVGPLGAGEDTALRIVTGLGSGVDSPEIRSEARVVANETDPDPLDNWAFAVVEGAADLSVAVEASILGSPGPQRDLNYNMTVTNLGPVTATGVVLENTLIRSARNPANENACKVTVTPVRCLELPDDPAEWGVPECIDNPQRCDVIKCRLDEGVEPNEDEPIEFNVESNGNCATIRAVAEVRSDQFDPDVENNVAEETTPILRPSDADLAVVRTVTPDPAIAGQLLTYTLTVLNNGPGKANQVSLEADLPSGVSLQGLSDDCDEVAAPEGTVAFDLGKLDADEEKSCSITVRVDPDAVGPLESEARVSDQQPSMGQMDPVFNNTSVTTTAVVAPVVLPRFMVDFDDPTGVTTLLAVRNTTAEATSIGYRYFNSAGETLLPREDPALLERELLGREVLTENLRELDLGAGLVAGYFGVTVFDPQVGVKDEVPSVLSGDAFRVDPGAGLASGNLLVALHPPTTPPGLCRSFSLGFENGGRHFDSTDFLFFVPGNPGGIVPVVVGRVYNPDGRFVQEVEIVTDDISFERNSGALELLAASGTVEWTFRDDLTGHVEGIFKGDVISAAVPAFCTDPGPGLGDEAPHLILPWFSATEDRQNGLTTIFSVRNPSQSDTFVRFEYFDDFGQTLYQKDEPLVARGSRTVDLSKRELPAELRRSFGYASVTVIDPQTRLPDAEGPVLYGEFFHIDRERDFASGELLLDTRPSLVPPKLCRKWSVRFLSGELTTDFLFFVTGAVPLATGRVYDEEGNPRGEAIELSVSGERIFRTSTSELEFPVRFGTVEWELSGEARGHVSAVFTGPGGLAVGIPAICLD